MMSGLVGFITFPEGYKCTLFAPIPVKNSKARSALGPKDLTHDVGKNYLYFKYTMVYICDVSVSLNSISMLSCLLSMIYLSI
jgi:hypothetical protein